MGLGKFKGDSSFKSELIIKIQFTRLNSTDNSMTVNEIRQSTNNYRRKTVQELKDILKTESNTNKVTTLEEMHKIGAIANRAIELTSEILTRDKVSWFMDIEFAHQDTPLNLDALLDADDSNFIHDVIGIYNHLDRDTKRLTDCFVPRYAIN